MRLHFNPASPFVRMVRVTAHEAGVADDIELMPTGAVSPVEVHQNVAVGLQLLDLITRAEPIGGRRRRGIAVHGLRQAPLDLTDVLEVLGHCPAIGRTERRLQRGGFPGDRVED